MNIKQKVVGLMIAVMVAAMGIGYLGTPTAQADCRIGGNTVKTSIISGSMCNETGSTSDSAQNSAIWNLLMVALNILTAGIGIAAVGGIVYGSILYASAGDRAEQTKKAISVITNVVIGVIAYGLMYMVLNFLIPGGIFS